MDQSRCVLKVEGLDCPTEAAALRAGLAGTPGVSDLSFDLIQGTMTVLYSPTEANPDALIRRVKDRVGMRAEPLGTLEVRQPVRAWPSRWLAISGSGLALSIGQGIHWSGGSDLAARCSYVAAIFLGGIELLPKAVRALRRWQLDIHVLMSLAVVGALALSQWDEAATVAFLFGLSEAIEALSLDRARKAVRNLLEVAPETAELIGEGGVRKVPAREVRPGDRVLVRAGDRIPVDGKVVSGRSSVDQKAITGESIPVLREPGDKVFAATVNGEGTIEVEATAALGDAVVSKIVEQVRAAQEGRAPLERSIERFARIYTPIVVAFAVGLMVVPPLVRSAIGWPAEWTSSLSRGLVVLVIACPCALVIATPVAVVSALAAAARRGILIKGGQFLEAVGRLRVLAFDKTGTLTKGEPDVIEVVSAAGRADEDVLRVAAALGDRGGHVLGKAIARHARGLLLTVPTADDYQAVPGMGATGSVEAMRYHIGSHRYIDESGLCLPGFHHSLGEAEGNVGTAVALTAATGPMGWLRLADQPRPEAARALAELSDLGIVTVMLTGDNEPTAAAVARELGIGELRSGLLPADKAAAVAELEARRGPTGMVGDGVNDAPALAAARVSVALGGISSGAALETADIVLMSAELTGLPWLVRHSRRTIALIRQNIAIALGAKALVLLLAVLGQANLWMAIAADLGVSLVVVANALRLLRDVDRGN